MDSDTVVAFDLDGTLTESKMELDDEMISLITQLSDLYRIAIITGGTLRQIKTQVISKLPKEIYPLIKLFPTNGSAYCKYSNGDWFVEESDRFSTKDKRRIKNALEAAIVQIKWKNPERCWGEQLEDRGTQFTFSALGQEAPLEEKLKFDPDRKKRIILVERLQELLPDLEIGFGGTTSVDINKKGIDKAYGIRKMRDVLNISENHIIFVGDGLYPGGNDSAVLKTNAQCYSVEDIEETKQFIRRLLKYEI